MKKLLNRKGFTLVELIVVIAIIAILLAAVIPFFSTADARKNEARDYARSFYSNAQELMTDEKASKNTFFKDTGAEYLLVCAQVDENNTMTSGVKVYMSYTAGTDFEEPVLMDDAALTSAPCSAFSEFVPALQRMLVTSDRSGYFFAVVDKKYRVVNTYFANAFADDGDLLGAWSKLNGASFTAFYVIGERYVGAWPETYCDKDKVMLEFA